MDAEQWEIGKAGMVRRDDYAHWYIHNPFTSQSIHSGACPCNHNAERKKRERGQRKLRTLRAARVRSTL